MKRFSILVAALAAVLLFTRPALAVNLHNGAIVVHNNTQDVIYVRFENGLFKGHFIYGYRSLSIAPGKALITDACCFAAGTPYVMHADRLAPEPVGGKLTSFVFTPHLCNRNGIPYGYAVIVVKDNNAVQEVEHGSCYEGPH